MPQPHDVTLNYEPENTTVPFGPDPHRVSVGPGDTIQFRIGEATRAAHPNCRLRITIHKPQHFSRRVLEHAAGQDTGETLTVNVVAPSAAALESAAINHIITGYKCELLDSEGSPIQGLTSDGSDGGEIVPGSS